ncbi:MAG: MraY family glycosyltransferase [Gemmatimonadota bacterium]
MVSPDHRPRPLPLLHAGRVAAAVLVAVLLADRTRDLLIQAGLRWLHLLLLAAAAAYVATPVAYHLAHRLGALDMPAGRKAHGEPTALLGGAAVYGAFALAVLRNFTFSVELKGVALGASLVFAIGVLDDLWEVSARLRLAGQVVAVGILIHYGVAVSFLPETWWGHAGEWLLTALWVIGITNAVNFLDGMDGLAAGCSGIGAAFFGLVALQNGQYYMLFLALPLAGACAGFLVYNFRPGRRAHIFLGDGGSTFLGFMMASLAVMGDWASGSDSMVRLMVPVLILGVPIFDMTFTTIVRVATGQVRTVRQWLEYTGRDHIHYQLEAMRTGRAGAVVIIYTLCLWLGLSALALKNTTGINALLQVAQSAIVFGLLAFFMLFVRRKYTEIEGDAVIAGLDPGDELSGRTGRGRR